ncbi:MAG: hypothetical protein DRJ98_06080, partial [Thermoprotei archaeon]
MRVVKKIYYAHPVGTYGTIRERVELELISSVFPGGEVINPAELVGVVSHADMDEFRGHVASCDVLVYSDVAGFVTAGVVEEVEEALRDGKPVYRLDWRTGELVEVHTIGDRLGINDTRKLFYLMQGFGLDDVALDDLIREKIAKAVGRISRVEALRQVFNELLGREAPVPNGVRRIDVYSRFYHWWQEPNRARFKVNRRLIAELINRRVEEMGASSLRDLVLNKLGLPPSRYAFYKNFSYKPRTAT